MDEGPSEEKCPPFIARLTGEGEAKEESLGDVKKN